MQVTITRSTPIQRTARVLQLEGMFDVPPTNAALQQWDVDLPLPADWNVGLIVGPSGSGKTTVARELFGGALVDGWPWPPDKSVLDGFPAGMGIKDITAVLSSVGFSSPPAWLRPFAALSNGEQFRVHLARTLAEKPDLAVVDEFTSVVDRTVAQVGSACVAKAVRARGQRFIAVTCHYDVAEWLAPDWVYQPHTGEFTDFAGRCQRRPSLTLDIFPIERSAWRYFRQHHYLSADINPTAQCFGAYLGDSLVAFASYIHFPHATTKNLKTSHRLVVLPDYQGIGIGSRLSEWIGEHLAAQGFRFHRTTAHPAVIGHCNRSPRWAMLGKRAYFGTTSKRADLAKKNMEPRRMVTASFAYVPDRSGR